ncbi:hypothetical protein QBC38DRAFT_54461 [Podospora fimiseda]|uniref:Fungal N-terminal domain-containing protein n=1 Tax=Podospora fimiseda TaxID=252190 RepID=A0AAN7BH49_9PEZI|nr:hypothetical protein QBC38DRAFT_54461 [Podospora fimiseda]
MAEILGLASGAISVVAFAGQLAKGAAFLHKFISDIKDAPRELIAITEELEILRFIFISIESSTSVKTPVLVQALKHSQHRLETLQDFVNKYVDGSPGRPRIWNQFKAVTKQGELQKCLQELERSKSMLLQACNKLARDEQTESILSLTTTVHNTLEVVKGATADVAHRSIQVTNVTTDTHANTQRLLQLTEKIETATQSLVYESLNKQDHYSPHALSVLKNTADRVIKNTLKRELRRHLRAQGRVQGPLEPKDSSLQTTLENSLLQRRGNHSQSTPDVSDGQQRHLTRWRKQSLTTSYSNEVTIPYLGKITLQTRTTSYTSRDEDSGDCDARQKNISTTTVSFLPSRTSWLANQGGILSYKKSEMLGRARRESPAQWTLRTVNILPGDAEIFRACRRHDINTVRILFDQRLASPYDVDDGGRSLLGWVANAINTLDLSVGKRDVGRLRDVQSLVYLLTEHGIDSASMDEDDNSPLMLFVVCSSLTSRTSTAYDEVFGHLFDKILTSARTDPFATKEAFIKVDRHGDYHLREFPGIIGQTPQDIFTFQIESLLRQQEWEIAWNVSQLRSVCDLWDFPTSGWVVYTN